MQMRPVETLGEISNILRLMEQPPRKVVAPKWITLAAALSGQQAEGSAVLVVLSWSCPRGLCVPSVVPEPRHLGGTPLLLHTNMFSSCSGSFLPLNRTHFPASFVVLQIMGYKELMAEYKSI